MANKGDNEEEKHRRNRGSGSIYFDKHSERWVGVLDLGMLNGRRQRRKVSAKTVEEVAEKLEQLRHHLDMAGGDIPLKRPKVETFLWEWLTESFQSGHIKPKTYESYEGMIRIHIVPALGFKRLDELSPRDVKRMVDAMQQKRLSADTIRIAHAVLRSALSEAERMEYVDRNVAKLVRLPKTKKRKPVILVSDQVGDFFRVLREHRHYPLYLCALTLGLRRQELLSLDWQDLDLEQGTLAVEASKTPSGERTLSLPGFLVQALREHRLRQEIERDLMGENWREHGLVFSSGVGTPMSGRNLFRHFKSVLKKAGLPRRMHFHDFRHNCATFLVSKNVHPRVAMNILGHSQISITMNYYAHVQEPDQRAALEQIALYLEETLQIDDDEWDDEDEWDEGEDDDSDEEGENDD
jgi:integrase